MIIIKNIMYVMVVENKHNVLNIHPWEIKYVQFNSSTSLWSMLVCIFVNREASHLQYFRRDFFFFCKFLPENIFYFYFLLRWRCVVWICPSTRFFCRIFVVLLYNSYPNTTNGFTIFNDSGIFRDHKKVNEETG